MGHPEADVITADMKIETVIARYPETAPIFVRYGMTCVGCYISGFHDIATSAAEFGVDVDTLLTELNETVARRKDEG